MQLYKQTCDIAEKIYKVICYIIEKIYVVLFLIYVAAFILVLARAGIYHVFYRTPCDDAMTHLREWEIWRAIHILREYDCPEAQKIYLLNSPIYDSHLQLKNQTVTVIFLRYMDKTYPEIIQAGYDRDVIASTIDCNQNNLEMCLELEPLLPELRHKIIKALPVADTVA